MQTAEVGAHDAQQGISRVASGTAHRVAVSPPPHEEVRRLQAKEAAGATLVATDMAELQRLYAEWLYQAEEVDPDTASSSDVLQLLRDAPSPFARGLIYGKFQLRMGIAGITGRAF